jgi:hypothetical protein
MDNKVVSIMAGLVIAFVVLAASSRLGQFEPVICDIHHRDMAAAESPRVQNIKRS